MTRELSPEERTTMQTYDRQAGSWSSQHMTGGFWAEEMNDFAEALPGGRILEIGSGGGRDAQELIAAGYEYTGSDISQGLLEQARKNNPGVRFDDVSVYDLDYEELFDGFWCSAVLLHIPRDQISEALNAINRNMKRGAIGFISVKEGDGERMETDDKSTQGDERYFIYWSDDEFTERLNGNGFKVLKRGYKPMSEKTRWLTYIVEIEEKGTEER